jgi:hypothetical protein
MSTKPCWFSNLPAEKFGMISLYKTYGNRTEKHKVVLYLGCGIDWGARQLERNGNKFGAIASCPMNLQAMRVRRASYRVSSFQYNGVAPANLKGLEEDLQALKLPVETVKRFIEAARSILP